MGNLSTLQNTIARSSGNSQNRKRGNGNGNGNGNGKKPSRAGKFVFEPIEPRLLLSTDLGYAGTAAFDLKRKEGKIAAGKATLEVPFDDGTKERYDVTIAGKLHHAHGFPPARCSKAPSVSVRSEPSSTIDCAP